MDLSRPGVHMVDLRCAVYAYRETEFLWPPQLWVVLGRSWDSVTDTQTISCMALLSIAFLIFRHLVYLDYARSMLL